MLRSLVLVRPRENPPTHATEGIFSACRFRVAVKTSRAGNRKSVAAVSCLNLMIP